MYPMLVSANSTYSWFISLSKMELWSFDTKTFRPLLFPIHRCQAQVMF
jgi:hypothetical protein